ncbi:MAG TPA: MogA/MoaB family molybdenum cofactor biosynthesis protein [Tepidisphaeraceae bacterium]|nr:MogA/MoaB family molybdenum cofactor biosynthesis protein [Tepidisphaeraceae bacterium]
MSYRKHIEESSREPVRCAVLTISDTRTPETDISGRRMRELLVEGRHQVVDSQILPDEPLKIQELIKQWLGRSDIDAILTNGGTGVSRRDQTMDVIDGLLDRVLPGFGELFRMLSWEEIGSGAMLSRAEGGVARDKLLFALPGSTAAVELGMKKLILPELKHLLNQIRK